MAKSFTASLKDFETLTMKNVRFVASESIQDVLEAAQTPQQGITKGATSFVEGKIPVADSELINSLEINGAGGEAAITTYIDGFQIGQVDTFSWTAPHALRMELGFTGTDELGREYNQPGRFFVTRNAERFSEFVEANAKKVRG